MIIAVFFCLFFFWLLFLYNALMKPTSPPDSESPPDEGKKLHTGDILSALLDGRELGAAETTHLLKIDADSELLQLRQAADELRQRQSGEEVPYASQLSILLTNHCELDQMLHEYPREPGQKGAFILSIDDIDERLERARTRQVDQVYLSNGGFWADLQIPGFESASQFKMWSRLLDHIRERHPLLTLTGFSPDEIEFLRIIFDRDASYVLEWLKDKGLKGLGGQRTAILDDKVRNKISPKLARVKTWTDIAKAAAKREIPLTASIGYGHFETHAQQAAHLIKLRNFQRKHPGAFTLLTPQPYQSKGGKASEAAISPAPSGRPRNAIQPDPVISAIGTDPKARRRMQAVCRLVLGADIPQQQVTWVLDDAAPQQAQESLQWGASHFGTTDALAWPAFLAGSKVPVTFKTEELAGFIEDAGRKPERKPLA